MIILNQRQQELLGWVQREGHVTVEALATHFGVTHQTIRRDIALLADNRLLQRIHGGASAQSSVENVAYNTRQVMCIEEKRRIARQVAEQIPNHASLFINLGTTTEEVAKALHQHRGLHVITNNLNVAAMMCNYPDCEVIVASGVMRPRDMGIIGESTIEFIRKFKVDYGIIGISSIEQDGTLRDYDMREVRTSDAIIHQSRNVFLVADHTKFGRPAMVELGPLSRVTALFTDLPPPEDMAAVIAESRVELYIAP
ncbi:MULTISPECIES: DeoR/GlpR family DNA-binding transcription regulator [unclassified Paludibacterium]|uniref:DeoR/GlpR family DNA-binding transcription regulator n=1 Tax=unclassified Paludibacterium TaxID=2618429 RepID=UPI001C055747|nr:DeoR family transcriptional regulator [Paludibacterium sp. B53371]BEV71539.1 DeoR/GlpR family DNA-binding transcription regulator [Paludibacterium sp. THUN1379]